MLTPGDIIELDLGAPAGAEAGTTRPAIVVTAARVLRGRPNVIQVVPLTRTLRDSGTEVIVEPDGDSGLWDVSAAQCQHIRSVSTHRVTRSLGNVGPLALRQIRETLSVLLDL